MKQFNLLEDPWIPVRTTYGENHQIRAYEIARKDIVALDAPRPDFNAALIQFLIGLIQTVLAPETPRDWRKRYAQPPSEDELKEVFKSIKPAFYLDGDGFRFMQDELAIKVGKHLPIEEMVFGAPGGSSKVNNKDHFIKKSCINGLCYSCSISSILTANIFAEDGGQGYFQSMRGNGFITTLVQADGQQSEMVLWENIWLNILPQKNIKLSNNMFYWNKEFSDKQFLGEVENIETEIKDLKKKKKNTEKKEKQLKEIQNKIEKLKTIFPDENDFQVYWAWMRRFHLDTQNMVEGQCSLCNFLGRILTHFHKTNKGYKYPKELWQNAHPFSPSIKYHRQNYTENNLKYKDKMLTVEMTTSGLPYIYWQDYIKQSEKQAPAKVISQHLRKELSEETQLIIWTFGYAMDSNTPLGWYESKTPLYILETEQVKIFEQEVNKYISAANKISDNRSGYLINSIKSAWFDEDKNKNKDSKKVFYSEKAIEISKSFLNNTENKFFELLKSLYEDSSQLTDEKLVDFREQWYKHIKQETEKLFNRWAFKSGIQTNPKRISLAYKDLNYNLNSSSLKHAILGLPKENTK